MATFLLSDGFPNDDDPEASAPLDLRARVLAYERRLIAAALAEAGGNQRRAARLLGILPTTLHEKLKRFGLHTPGTDARSATSPDQVSM
jgi:DNA-binding NtrC family response regulator